MQERADTAGLGHSNKKQKLQFYLRLKLQLEIAAHPPCKHCALLSRLCGCRS